MKKLSGVLSFLLIVLVTIVISQCKKKSIENTDGSATPEQAEQFRNFVAEQIKKDGIKVSYHFDEGELVAKSSLDSSLGRLEGFCVSHSTVEITQYDYEVTGDVCNNTDEYTSRIYFTITDSKFPPPTGGSGISFDITPDDGSGTQALGTTYLGNPSFGVYKFVTDDIDCTAMGIDYCNTTKFDIAITFEPTGCPSPNTPIPVDFVTTLTFSSFSECKTVYPVWINPNVGGSGSFGYGGFVIACSYPCNFYAPDKFDLDYRLQGTSTWTTLTADYLNAGPFIVYGLSSGTYEYRFRNKMNSPSCTGPWSDIKTTVIS